MTQQAEELQQAYYLGQEARREAKPYSAYRTLPFESSDEFENWRRGWENEDAALRGCERVVFE